MKRQLIRSKMNGSKGFALTEVLLSIAVIAFIGIGAYSLYRNSRISAQVEQTANDMAIIQKGIQTYFQGQTSFSSINNGVSATTLEQAGIIPDDMKTSTTPNGTWDNAWGGQVGIAPLSSDTGQYKLNALFNIDLTAVPTSACTQLINRVQPAFLIIGTGSADGTTQGAEIKGGSSTDYNVDLSQVATVCQGTNGSASLAFSSN